MIGVIGYGYVGRAIANNIKSDKIICDPAYNDTSIQDVIDSNPQAIFVCVPTPTDGSNFEILRNTLDELKGYEGVVIVKSTVLPEVIAEYDVVYSPELLSRRTAEEDVRNPPLLILGGERALEAAAIYVQNLGVSFARICMTDIKTAALAKYTMNSFYAMKVTFMNQIYDVATEIGADYDKLKDVLSAHPWMGSHHFEVPGWDGQRGFGGPCLPKDTKAFAETYDIELLKKVLAINSEYRDE